MTEKAVNTRSVVLNILTEQEKSGEKLNRLIDHALDKHNGLSTGDRAFIKILTEGSVERRITIDHVIDRFSSVKTAKMKPLIRNILRMSVYQLLFMDSVPAHAAINEAVKLVKKRHMGNLSSFVNGVLRSIDREGFDLSSVTDPEVCYSCPEWIYELFLRDFGGDKARSILKASLDVRPVYIRTNISRISPEKLRERLSANGIEVKKTALFPYAFVIEDFGGLKELKEFREGLFSVQDISSMSIGDEIRKILDSELPESFGILDACAAPGGKSCHAAEVLSAYIEDHSEKGLKHGDFNVLSRDISPSKLLLIEENRERLGLDLIKTAVFDAAAENGNTAAENGSPSGSGTDCPYDLIIADLPCSGLGVMGRKNDLKYRVQPEDIISLKELQRKILENLDTELKSGGYLIFSVCTVDREETFEQDSWIREKLRYEKIKDRLFIPGEEDSDGFYYALYRKRA